MEPDETNVDQPHSRATGDVVPALQGAHRFLTLDALRGVAAVVVVVHHLPHLFGRQIFPHGYLAVDFFFMLSGFVLTFAFQPKLDGGLSTATFMRRRLVRLYPLYLLGLTLGLVVLVLQRAASPYSMGQLAFLYALGTLMVPAWKIFGHAWSTVTPLDMPEWSVVYEVGANVFHALLYRRRGRVALLSIIGISGVLLAAHSLWIGDMNVGVFPNAALGPALRVVFSYFLGIAVFRVWRSGRLAIAVPSYVPMLLLILCLYVPGWGRYSVAGDLATVAFVFPMLLLLGANAKRWAWLDGVFAMLGAVSYPIYVLHVPLVGPFSHVWIKLLGQRPDPYAPWSGIAFLVCLVLISQGVLKFYDTPVRAMLGRRLRG